MSTIHIRNYDRGMSANEDAVPEDLNGLEDFVFPVEEQRSAAYHEAGHAVAFYAFGRGLKEVCLNMECATDPTGEPAICFGGLTTRLGKEKRFCCYSTCMLATAIVGCAGPAAEIKHRRAANIPLRMSHGTVGDSKSIEEYDRFLCRKGKGNGHSLGRLAWWAAWHLLDEPKVWLAICELAKELCEKSYDTFYGDLHPGDKLTARMSGRLAAKIIQRCGVRQKRIRRSDTIFPLRLAE